MHNFIKKNPTIKSTPAMASKLTNRQWTFEDIVARIERNAPRTGPKGPRVVREVNG